MRRSRFDGEREQMAILFWLGAIIAGISNPLQSGSNAELFKRTGTPLVAALIVYAIGASALLLASPFIGLPVRGALAKLHGAPWWLAIGGLCNVTFLLASLTITKKLGSGTFTTLVVVSAAVTSVLLDHFGLLGLEQRALTLWRGVGVALAIAGVFLIARF
jgi:transporter family-2 protein